MIRPFSGRTSDRLGDLAETEVEALVEAVEKFN
jgi:hypothetical protein